MLATTICTPAMNAPAGSVTTPERVTAGACAEPVPAKNRKIRLAAHNKNKERRTEKRMEGLLSRLAREAGSPRIRDRFRLSRLRTPSVSWLGGTAPRGLPALRRFRRAESTARTRQGSGTRGIFPALQSRGGDGFAPSSRHGVCVIQVGQTYSLSVSVREPGLC